MIIPFPPQRPADTTAIPFGPDELREIAEHLNAAAPEILDAVILAGGSAVTMAFMDWLGTIAVSLRTFMILTPRAADTRASGGTVTAGGGKVVP